MNTLILPINPVEGDILKVEHVCYFTKKHSEDQLFKIDLYEIVDETWKHPQTELLTINKIDYKFLGTFNRQSLKAAGIVLLEACENNLQEIFGKKG